MESYAATTGVLVACSDKSIRAAVRDVIANASGVELLVAEEGGSAVAISRARQPLVAFVDLYVAGMGGLEAAAEIRAASPATTIVMVGVPARLDHEIAYEAGAEICTGLDPQEVATIARRELRLWLTPPEYLPTYGTAATA